VTSEENVEERRLQGLDQDTPYLTRHELLLSKEPHFKFIAAFVT